MDISSVWCADLNLYESDEGSRDGLRSMRLNLLIGPNNSGKSRLLRALYSSAQESFKVGVDFDQNKHGENFSKLIDFIRENIRADEENYMFLDLLAGKCLSVTALEAAMTYFEAWLVRAAEGGRKFISHSAAANNYNALRVYIDRSDFQLDEIREAASLCKNEVLSLKGNKRYYIPILRGMRPLREDLDLYSQRTYKDYFPGRKEDSSIITGYDLYTLLAKFLLGQPENRRLVRDYEKILGHEFFGGAEVTLIPEYGKDTVSVKIGDEKQFSIYDLGDGMQQVIIITSAAFLEPDKSIFFIEEPEACLHPGLLRKLALFLLNHTKHQYYATTHSNHLLDLAEIDGRVLVHKVLKVGSNRSAKFKVLECTRDRTVLAEIGVLASSVYLANSTIWVEGVTDRLYLTVFLKKYIDDLASGREKSVLEGLLENYHYTFVEYQGGNLSHWSFADDLSGKLQAARLCATAFLIADGDISGKGTRVDDLTGELGFRLHVLGCKEIENLLPREIIISTAKKIFSNMRGCKLDGLNAEMLTSLAPKIETSSSGIGFHLDKALGLKGRGKSVNKVFAEDSGTIKNKVKFCILAIEEMTSVDWKMGAELNLLCRKIFEHVLRSNSLA